MANNITVKDAAAANVVVKTTDVVGVHTPHHIPEGNVAHDGIDSGNPLKIGGKASTATPVAVANADRVDAYFDETGRLHVVNDGVLVHTADSVEVRQTLHDNLNANANLQINNADVANANPVPISDAGGSITIDGSVGITGALPAGTNNIGDVDVLSLPALPAGTNNIGDVDVLTLPALPAGTNNIGDVDVLTLPAIPAGANHIGSVTAKLSTDTIQNGATALVPKFATVAASTLGDNTVVAAVVGKKIRVLSYTIVAAAATNVFWKSATAGAITGTMAFAANGGTSVDFSPVGHFETTAGEALVLNLSAANSVAGHITYIEV